MNLEWAYEVAEEFKDTFVELAAKIQVAPVLGDSFTSVMDCIEGWKESEPGQLSLALDALERAILETPKPGDELMKLLKTIAPYCEPAQAWLKKREVIECSTQAPELEAIASSIAIG